MTNVLGRTVYVDPLDARGQAMMTSRADANPDSLRLWQRLLDLAAWDHVVDVGANYGEMIAGARLPESAAVHVFEASPAVVPFLRETLGELGGDADLHQVAVGGEDAEEVTFNIDVRWSGKSGIAAHQSVRREDVRVETVPMRTLDSVLTPAAGRWCVKVDVEGAELDVLTGAKRLLTDPDLTVLMLEILHMSVQQVAKLAASHPLHGFDIVTGELRRLPSDPLELGRVLHGGEVYRQDAVILGGQDWRSLARRMNEGIQARPRRAVYTALMGGYEHLQEQPIARDSDVPFICFTDNPSLTSETWEVRLVEPMFRGDAIRSARHLKIMGHESLASFDETIWVDNRVQLLVDPDEVIEDTLVDADFFAFQHSFRDQIVDEFEAVASGGYDDPARVYEQLHHYAELYPGAVGAKPVWTGFLVRRRTPACQRAMEIWCAHVLRYSRRDQLSVVLALSESGVRAQLPKGDNRSSRWHAWPPLDATLGRDKSGGGHRFEVAVRAPVAELRAQRVRGDEELAATREALDATKRDLRKLQEEREALRRSVAAERDRADRLDRRIKQQRDALDKTRRDRRRYREELQRVRASRSFRLARRVASLKRGGRLA